MRVFVVLLVLGCMGAGAAEAQRRRVPPRPARDGWLSGSVQLGLRGGYTFDEEVGSAGAQLRVPLMRQLWLAPSGDVFLDGEDSRTEWQMNADVAARPAGLGGLYGGVGAAFVDRDFDGDGDSGVETGYNLFLGLGGSALLDSRASLFVEARWTRVEDYEPFRLVAGINVPLH